MILTSTPAAARAIAPASPTGPAIAQLTAAQAGLQALPAMVGPGKPVPPVIAGLAGVRDALDGARPRLVARHASDWMLGQMDRVRGAAQTLGDSLTDLAARDGMTTFDAAFAADAPSWQAWFVESAELVGRAQQAVSA